MVYTLEECCEDLVNMTTPEMFLFLEKTSPQAQSSMFDKVIQKVKDIKDALVKWISEFFQKHFTKQTEARINQALDANPELKNKKIQIKDQEKLGKLQSETIKKIKSAKSESEVDDAMRRYKKQRNAIAVVSIAVVAALGLLYRRKSKQTSTWMDRYDEAAGSIETLTGELKDANEAISKWKAKTISTGALLTASNNELKKTREQRDNFADKNKRLKSQIKTLSDDFERIKKKGIQASLDAYSSKIEVERLRKKNSQIALKRKQIAALSTMTSDIASDEESSIMELAKATRLVINPANAKVGQVTIPLEMKSQPISKADQMRAARNKKRK